MTARAFSFRFSMAYALMMLGSGVQLPFLPLWLSAKGIDVQGIAIVVAGMMAVRVVASPLFAWIADHSGKRRLVIRLCAFSAFLCYLALGFMDGFWPIVITSLVAAFLFSPVFPLSEGFSVDASAALGLDYGRMRLWASLSFLVGSLGSGLLLMQLSPLDTAFLLAGAQGLAVIATLVMPDEVITEDDGEDADAADAVLPMSSARFLLASSFPLFLLAAGLGQASHGMMNGFSSVYWTGLGFSPATIGLLWAVAVLAEVVLLANSNAILKRFGVGMVFLIGLFGGVVRWAAMAYVTWLPALFVVQGLHALSFAMTHLGTMHMIRIMVPDHVRNRAQGLNAAISGGVLMSGSLWLSGSLFKQYGAATFMAMMLISLAALTIGVALMRVSPRVRGAGDASFRRRIE
jgi:MFS transporter, PPP family, 3-phenylpropionic acid transporter